ncbi:MAG: ketopantoate reductase family protein [Deltaproteobacteria bacterium]|nr:ketopantoate reductase family protein [Deltaproteobacteria bacterium]
MDGRNICIVGAGAVGLMLAAKFQTHHNVFVLTRPYRLKELRSFPVKISGAQSIEVPPSTLRFIGPEELTSLPHDASFWLCVKAYDLEASIRELLPYWSTTNTVVVLSNGLGVFFQAATLIGKTSPVVRLCPEFGVQRLEPTHVLLSGALKTMLAGVSHQKENTALIREILTSCSVLVEEEKDVATAEWKKIQINLTINPICSILNCENNAIANNSKLRALATTVLSEINQVAKADGFELGANPEKRIIDSLEINGSNINSTLCDLRAGNKTEMDFMLGRFLRLAEDYDIPVPACRTLYALFKFLEDRALNPAPAWEVAT